LSVEFRSLSIKFPAPEIVSCTPARIGPHGFEFDLLSHRDDRPPPAQSRGALP
jgi:hypothetical protein